MSNKQTKTKNGKQTKAPKAMSRSVEKRVAVQKATTPKMPPKPVFGPDEIAVAVTDNGQEKWTVVKAQRVGEHFGVHESLKPPKRFVVTHVGTGLAGATFRKRATALWVADKMGTVGLDWKFTDALKGMKKATPEQRAKLHELRDESAVEEAMKKLTAIRSAQQTVAGQGFKPITAVTPGAPQYSAPWRSGVDWVAAGRKAYETRMRNLAAKQAAAAAAAAAQAAQPARKGRRAVQQ